MSVIITPSNTLGFNRPLTVVVKRTLSIANHNASPVAFKVKTTAPKLYCVRPNSGRVEPGETVEVSVMLQAMKEEPPLSAKCKDKFLIQSTAITPEKETLSLQDIWTAEPSEEVHSQKIRVVYLPPEGTTVPEEDENHADIARLTLLNPDQFETAPSRPANGHATRGIPDFQQTSTIQPAPEPPLVHIEHPPTPPPQPRVEPTPPPRAPTPPPPAPPVEEEYPAEDLADQTAYVSVNVHAQSPPTPPPPAPPLPAPVPVVVPDPNEDLIAQLKLATSEIERLRNIISSMPDPSTTQPDETEVTSAPPPSEYRRRTRAFSDDGSTLSPETEIGSYVDDGIGQPEGVPLQVVIVIALGVFVTTYLFF